VVIYQECCVACHQMFLLVILASLITPCDMLTYVLVGIDCLFLYALTDNFQSQWPLGLRRGSGASCLLGLRA